MDTAGLSRSRAHMAQFLREHRYRAVQPSTAGDQHFRVGAGVCHSGVKRQGAATIAQTDADACWGCDHPGGTGYQHAALVCAGRIGRDAPSSRLGTAQRDALRGVSIQNSLSL